MAANTGNNTNPGNEIHSFPSGLIRPVANPAMAATTKAIVINTNKIYIKPEHPEWDVRIELPGGFAFVNDIIGKVRAVSGVTTIKEI